MKKLPFSLLSTRQKIKATAITEGCRVSLTILLFNVDNMGNVVGYEEVAHDEKPQWTTTPPGPGWWWHSYGEGRFAYPHRLNITKDGVLRSDHRTCRDGYFIAATEIGGVWWPVEIQPPPPKEKS